MQDTMVRRLCLRGLKGHLRSALWLQLSLALPFSAACLKGPAARFCLMLRTCFSFVLGTIQIDAKSTAERWVARQAQDCVCYDHSCSCVDIHTEAVDVYSSLPAQLPWLRHLCLAPSPKQHLGIAVATSDLN